jgi:hypothetical protein
MQDWQRSRDGYLSRSWKALRIGPGLLENGSWDMASGYLVGYFFGKSRGFRGAETVAVLSVPVTRCRLLEATVAAPGVFFSWVRRGALGAGGGVVAFVVGGGGVERPAMFKELTGGDTLV